MLRFVWRDLLHNPRRTLASLVGVTLGVGLFSGVLFFIDGSGATMTERSLAPLALDIQRVITSPPSGGLRLSEELSPQTALEPGQEATITLTLTNDGSAPANEVVVNDVPPPPLAYVNGTTVMDGSPVPDIDGESPLSHGLAGFGLNVGRVESDATMTISYTARAEQAVDDVASLRFGGTVSSREQVVPAQANAPTAPTLDELREQVARIDGVAEADGLGFVDLPPGSLASAGAVIRDPVRVFAFDRDYQAHYPSIRIVEGGFDPGSALVSAEAAGTLAVTPGEALELSLPGRRDPLPLRVGGIVDLARAEPLFASRRITKLEEFLYVPDAVVVTPETFRDEIIPSFAAAGASVGSVTKSFPVLELDVLVDRSRLHADPGSALEQTRRIADAIDRIGADRDFLIDNISNTLTVARDDAAVGKRMFLFLGVPGLLMAVFLTAYVGSILAAVQRREQAILRVRGADRGHLRRIAAYKALAIAGAGSVLGVAIGLGTAAAILGWNAIFRTAPEDLIVSGLIAGAAGAAVTALALYIPAGRSVSREIGQERREMPVARIPVWRRAWLDVVLLAAAGIAELLAIRTGALDPPPGSVYSAVAISVPSRVMPAPLLAWMGGTLLCVRAFEATASRLPVRSSARIGVVRRVLSRSLRRRSWTLATGIVGLALVVGFGMGLIMFSATYDAAKAADSRFVVGSDIRIVPSILSNRSHLPSFASALTVPGVSAVTPVVFELENSVLIGPDNQGRANLAGIDPASFARVAPLPDSLFVDRTGSGTVTALEADPRGVLVDEETADDLSVETGDTVEVILALGTERETQEPFRVVGLFERFPGFPQGANLVVNLDRYEEVTGLRRVDLFLAEVTDRSDPGLTGAIDALRSGPGEDAPMHIDSTRTTLDRDQSSLTALNVTGLVGLNSFFVLLMSVAAIAIFVFGLMLQRRREYVTLRAQGLQMRELQVLVLGEAAVVAVCGLAAGILVGSGVSVLMIQILRSLFVLDPTVTVPVGPAALLASLVLTATVVSGLAAAEVLRRLKPTEILREE